MPIPLNQPDAPAWKPPPRPPGSAAAKFPQLAAVARAHENRRCEIRNFQENQLRLGSSPVQSPLDGMGHSALPDGIPARRFACYSNCLPHTAYRLPLIFSKISSRFSNKTSALGKYG